MYYILYIDVYRYEVFFMIDYKDNALIFKALADENRLQILEIIKGGEICACEILDRLNIVQSTLSHHMKILCDSNILNSRKEGKWTYYSFNCDSIENIKDILNYYLSKDINYTSNNIKCN